MFVQKWTKVREQLVFTVLSVVGYMKLSSLFIFFRVGEFIVMIITAIVPHGMNIGRCITQWYPK